MSSGMHLTVWDADDIGGYMGVNPATIFLNCMVVYMYPYNLHTYRLV